MLQEDDVPTGISDMQDWWESLDDGQRGQLRAGIKSYPLKSEVSQLLFDTKCPALPTAATEAPEGVTIGMPAEVAEIINQENNRHD
jgi:hypothetical protein